MENEREEEEKREKWCLRFGAKRSQNPYKKCSKKVPNQNKTRVQFFGTKNKSARTVCGFRPSGWFPRARFSGSQKSIRTSGRIFGWAPVGLSFEGLPDSESSEI